MKVTKLITTRRQQLVELLAKGLPNLNFEPHELDTRLEEIATDLVRNDPLIGTSMVRDWIDDLMDDLYSTPLKRLRLHNSVQRQWIRTH